MDFYFLCLVAFLSAESFLDTAEKFQGIRIEGHMVQVNFFWDLIT